MRRNTFQAIAVLGLAIVLWECGDGSRVPAGLDSPSSQFARGGVKGKPGGGSGGGKVTNTATVVTFLDRIGDNIRSDQRGSYTGGACGVLADFNLGDARLDPDASRIKRRDQNTCGAPRALTFEWDLPDGGGVTKPTRVDGIFMNIDQVEMETGMGMLHAGQFDVCNRLVFNPDDAFLPGNGSDLLQVSFNDGGNTDPADDTWTVRTQPFPNDKGYCVGDDRLWHMPFELTIRRR